MCLVLEVALDGKQSLRLGWSLLCSSELVAVMSVIPSLDNAEAVSA